MKKAQSKNRDGAINEFTDADSFIRYATLVYDENEKYNNLSNRPIKPKTVIDCRYYINAFCDNLTLTEF